MEQEFENDNSLNVEDETLEEVQGTETEEKEEPKYSDNERKLYARVKTLEAKNKELLASKGTPTKSDSAVDYGQKAFLVANGIKGAKEFDFVQAELKNSGLDLDGLLENDYFQAKLDKFRTLQKTAEATPTGKRSSGVATESVDYWMTKPFEEVPMDMRPKVVQARLDKDKNKGKFYNT